MNQLVHITFQRVQTWLFMVPRLRAMIGANVLLGETLRLELPRLARETGTWNLDSISEEFVAVDLNDPLKEHDDPAADASGGILSRDGGHFEAQFTLGAEDFAREAAVLIQTLLPGLQFRVLVDNVEQVSVNTAVSMELPVLLPCKWTGKSLASETIWQGDETTTVSTDVKCRFDAAKRSEVGGAQDLVSLLTAATRLGSMKRPQELEELVGDGYMALIHADGNGVGAGANREDGDASAYFYRNRVLIRRALHVALEAHAAEQGIMPLVPLMLGGDDLLVVCRADVAFDFMITLSDALADLQRDVEGFRLTLGAGVVFAKHTIPIHRLHEIAGQLTSSAKRRYRGLRAQGSVGRSVIDWAVCTTAWVDDLEVVRRRDWLRDGGSEQRVLSQRPLDVLGEGTGCLAGLLGASRELGEASRSQLRFLIEQLPRGRALSELAFSELPPSTKEALHAVGISSAWSRASDGGPLVTPLLDLVEVAEIGHLGRALASSDIRDHELHSESGND